MSDPPATPAARLRPSVRRVLVKEVNWLGDLVISLPALRALRQAFPDASLAVLVKQELAGFFDGLGWVDRVIAYRVRGGLPGIRDRARLVSALRAERFDLAVVFPRSFEAALWVALGGVPRRAGLASQGRRALLTDRARPAPSLAGRHQAHDYLQMLRDTLGIEGVVEGARLEVREERRAAMREWLSSRRRRPGVPLIALGSGSAYGPAKQWPGERFAALIDRLAERVECVLVGSPSERPGCEAIAAATRTGAIVSAGATDIGDLVALLSLCAGFAGNDSGAMHAAAALGIPAVGIFGSTEPARTGPLGPRARVLYERVPCSPCLARTCRYGHYDCLKRVTVEQAAAALTDLGALASPGTQLCPKERLR